MKINTILIIIFGSFFIFSCKKGNQIKQNISINKETNDVHKQDSFENQENIFPGYFSTEKCINSDYLKLFEKNYENEFLLNPLDSWYYYNKDNSNLSNSSSFFSEKSLFCKEDYSDGKTIKRYMAHDSDLYFNYEFFEYDGFNRLKHYYNSNNEDKTKIANELKYEYYEDSEGRLYRFELADSLGATQINNTSQVLIQTFKDDEILLEQINSTQEDLRLLNYEKFHEKLNKIIYTVRFKDKKLYEAEMKDIQNNCIRKYSFSYNEYLINHIEYKELINNELEFEENILLQYDDTKIIKEIHKIRNQASVVIFEWAFEDFDEHNNPQKQVFKGQTVDLPEKFYEETYFWKNIYK